MPLEFKKMAVTCCLAFNQGFDQNDTEKTKFFFFSEQMLIFYFFCVLSFQIVFYFCGGVRPSYVEKTIFSVVFLKNI